jgi:hypothetical protein
MPAETYAVSLKLLTAGAISGNFRDNYIRKKQYKQFSTTFRTIMVLPCNYTDGKKIRSHVCTTVQMLKHHKEKIAQTNIRYVYTNCDKKICYKPKLSQVKFRALQNRSEKRVHPIEIMFI